VYIRKVHIENIKCFGEGDQALDLDLTHDDGSLAGWTAVAGPNGVGKTTLLQSLAVGHPFVAPFWFDKTFTHNAIKSGASVAKVEGDLVLNSYEASKDYGRMFVNFTKTQAFHRMVSDPPDEDYNKGWFMAAYGPFRRLARGSVDSQRLTDSPNRRIARLASLFREDVTFAETLQWLERLHLLRLENREGAAEILEGVLGLLSEGLLPGGAKAEKIDSDGLWILDGDQLRVLRSLSDGYQTITGLVLDLVRQLHGSGDKLLLRQDDDGVWRVHNEGVVMIDEMENHLHPEWQRKIGFWLKDHFPNIQFIVTTHSHFICQAADPGGLIRLSKPGEGPTARKISGETYLAITNSSADDAYLSELFGLERTRSDRADALIDESARLESLILSDKATTQEEARYRELRKQLPPSAEVTKSIRRLDQAIRRSE
jgi:predicted ATP-binding protein involved in virulence